MSSWYSITSPSGDGNDEYCKFCLTNFKVFHDMVNNVCQVCGRPAPKILVDKQQQVKITSINTPRDSSMLKGISTEIDYNTLFTKDDTKRGINYGDVRVQVNSFKEAIKFIHESDKSPSQMRMESQQDYVVKTNKSGQFDNKKEKIH